VEKREMGNCERDVQRGWCEKEEGIIDTYGVNKNSPSWRRRDGANNGSTPLYPLVPGQSHNSRILRQ